MNVRILFIEDDEEIADFVLRGLREEQFVVERAADGHQGWTLLGQNSWDVVLLDWWLPGIDGMTILNRFRKVNRTTPVLFLTARDAVSDRVKGLENGADDYLCKPFAFVELLARIRALTRRQDRVLKTTVIYGDLTIDLASHRVERSGMQLDLTARETSLLAFLMQHVGEVLPKKEIYEQVWKDEYDSLSNTLEVHIMELRKKMECSGPRLIHTLRNRGYRFADENR